MNTRSSTPFNSLRAAWWWRQCAAAVVCLLLGCLGGCVNQLNEYSIGGGVTMKVPTPHGFQPLGGRDTSLRSSIENSLSKRNALIEYYLTDDELNSVVHGDDANRSKDLLLYASPDPLSDRQFGEIVNALNRKYHRGSPVVVPGPPNQHNGPTMAFVTRPLGPFFIPQRHLVGLSLIAACRVGVSKPRSEPS